MQTEEEAREKWCPASRDHQTAGNRSQASENAVSEPQRLLCIASQCMAWRWGDPETGKEELPSGKIIDVTLNERGYCGLAGKPE